MKKLNPIGWGFQDQALDMAEQKHLVGVMKGFFDLSKNEHIPPPDAACINLPAPKSHPPESCAGFSSATHDSRLLFAAGRSYRDIVALRTDALTVAPDWVASPGTEQEVETVLEEAAQKNLAVIPFGGGSSVVGGVTPDVPDGFDGVVTLNLQNLNRVLDIDVRDRVIEAEGGILGPDLDAALKKHNLAVRHYPQSYFHSTLGGWIATRGAGHFSTLHAKIEDRVASVKFISPSGLPYETRPLPASSVAIDPNRLVAGSEGILGIITRARLRVVDSPVYKTDVSIEFDQFEQALEAGRIIVQAGLWPTQMRILDPFERMVSALTAGHAPKMKALMILSFESGHFAMDDRCQQAIQITEEFGGRAVVKDQSEDEQGAQDWKNSFFRQPYMRDALIDHGVIADTFETAVPWHKIPDFYHNVRTAVLESLQKTCGGGAVLCRVTHAYPDGVALYFSFYGLGKHGALIDQWWELKSAANGAIEQHGGTASHHHAMGRDHKKWAEHEVPGGYIEAVRGIKSRLDPAGIMNPGLWY